MSNLYIGKLEKNENQKKILHCSDIPFGKKFTNFSDLDEYYDKMKQTKLIVHGWLSSSEADYSIEMKNAYINNSDSNVIVMDWSAISGK